MILQDIAQILEDNHVGNYKAKPQNIFLGTIPLQRDGNTLLNLELSGGTNHKYLDLHTQVIDIKVLSNDSGSALSMLQMALDTLHKLSNTQTTGAYIYFVAAVMGVVFVGKDANQNSIYRFSVEVTYR